MGELATIDKGSWETIKEIAAEAFNSGLLPQAIKTPQMAAIIALKGRELGLPPMQALSGLYVVNGKVAMASELMMALIRGRCSSAKIKVVERTAKCCKIAASRNGGEPEVFEFNEADAKRADLIKPGGPWTKYPANMMYNRCVSNLARQMFPDIIAGASYTPEELGGDVAEQDLPPQTEGMEAHDVRDVSEVSSSQFDDSVRAKKIKELISKFAPLCVAEIDLKNKLKLDDLLLMTDEDIKLLNQLGLAIKNGKTTVAEAFPASEDF